MLRADWARRSARYERKEAEYKAAVRRLEDEIVRCHARDDAPADPDPLAPVAAAYRDVVSSLDQLESRRARLEAARKKDLERSYRARLWEPTKEADGLKKKNAESERRWRARADEIEAEKTWALDLCARLGGLNFDLSAQNDELRTRRTTGDDDRKRFRGV